jgi:hypothetical protein
MLEVLGGAVVVADAAHGLSEQSQRRAAPDPAGVVAACVLRVLAVTRGDRADPALPREEMCAAP